MTAIWNFVKGFFSRLGTVYASGGMLVRVLTLILDMIEKTPAESRRENLGKLDGAIAKAKAGETEELEKWLGRRL